MHRGLGALRDDDRLTGWMFQIARSAIAERGRDRMRHPIVAEPTAEPVAVVDDTEAGATHALSKCLTIFVARVRSPYREAITLVELDGTSRDQRGPAQLRQRLKECCEIAVDARWGRHRLHATPYGVLPFAGI